MKKRKIRNPSKNTIKRLVKAEMEAKAFTLVPVLHYGSRSHGFVKYYSLYRRITLMSKGAIIIGTLKGCERYGYKPPFAKDSETSNTLERLITLYWMERKGCNEVYGSPIWANKESRFYFSDATALLAEKVARISLDFHRKHRGDFKMEDMLKAKPLSVEDLIKIGGF